jgi:hypothetical protein
MLTRRACSFVALITMLVTLGGCTMKPEGAQPSATAAQQPAVAPAAGALPPPPGFPQPQATFQPPNSPTPPNSSAVPMARSVAQPAIEVGCSYNASQIVGGTGRTQLVNCPAGCADHGWVWGTDVYTTDSPVCNAAIHAGVIPPEGGDVMVILEEGRQAYRGSKRNGVLTADYGQFGSSFRVQRPGQ